MSAYAAAPALPPAIAQALAAFAPSAVRFRTITPEYRNPEIDDRPAIDIVDPDDVTDRMAGNPDSIDNFIGGKGCSLYDALLIAGWSNGRDVLTDADLLAAARAVRSAYLDSVKANTAERERVSEALLDKQIRDSRNDSRF